MFKNNTDFVVTHKDFRFVVSDKQTILNAARAAGIFIPHTCGGQGKCRTCKFLILDGEISPPNDIEKREENKLLGYRLACQSRVKTDIKVEFKGPVRKMEPVMGELQTCEGKGSQITVNPRENYRINQDRALLVSIEDAVDMSQDEMNHQLQVIVDSDKDEIAAGTLKEAPSFGSEEYSDEDYLAARQRKKLLYFNIEFTNKCNLACSGCFAGFGDVKNVYDLNEMEAGYRHTKEVTGPLILEELLDLIDQASELGAKTVDLIGGGEPLMSSLFFRLAEHAVLKGLEVEVFTNGTLIGPKRAKRMAELRILPFVKLYSSRSWVHDQMVGIPGAWERAVNGIENLLSAGYGADKGLPISLETIVVRRNAQDLPTMWRWARENGMVPYFERFVGCHYEGDPGQLLSPIELKKLWEELWLLDRGEYGFTWPLLPLRVGYTCATNFYSLYINYEGQVRPCSGVFVPLGDVRNSSLSEILKESPVVKDLREYERPSNSWCANCFYYKSDRCPGCRGMALASGSYMSDDPLCFHNPNNLIEISDPRNSPHLNNAMKSGEKND